MVRKNLLANEHLTSVPVTAHISGVLRVSLIGDRSIGLRYEEHVFLFGFQRLRFCLSLWLPAVLPGGLSAGPGSPQIRGPHRGKVRTFLS